MFDTPAEWHSALNDLPAALFFASVLFDWAGSIAKRDSLKAAAFWALILGVIGAVAAVISGLSAEGWVEHGGNAHRFIERHETLAITTTILFGALASWRVFRKGTLPGLERKIYLGIATVGLLMIGWVGHVGGTIVFRQGIGIPSAVLRETLADIERGHTHAPGEEHEHAEGGEHEHADDAAATDSVTAEEGGHEHPPGTPPHQH